ncbi:MAG: Gldg family protein [Proteobacteria bacterium]|nr:Gldg family protein [Pseudomonadota bacterium]
MTPISRRLYAVAAIALAAVIFVALNIAVDATFTSTKIDLTENGLYTLADGTKNTLDKLEEPITLKFYYSKKLGADYAQIDAYAGRVRDLLQQYVARGHGKIVLQEIDAEPFTPEEDEASSAGLSGAPTDSGDNVYFGLVGTNTVDGKETVAFFQQNREPYLEYDLTALIYKLSEPKKPMLGIISSLPLDTGAGGMQAMLQGQAQPFAIYQELAATYDTKMIDQNFDAIAKNIDILMIAHPGALNDQQLYAIDQFVLGGGRALVFVDPYAELANPGGGFDQQGAGPVSSDLPKLFAAWGVVYNPQKILADRKLAQRVQSGDPRNPVAIYPAWLHLGAEQFDSGDQITASLQSLNLASAGALSQAKGATTDFTPLITSSDESSLLDAMQVRLNQRPQDLMMQVEPTGAIFAIAARVSGPAKTAFPNGLPGAKAPQIKASTGPINVVVMADADIFDDRFWVRVENVYGKRVATPFADNAAFVLNGVENLSGSNDLISLRTRATSNRPFTKVQKIQADAQAKFQQEADELQQRLTDTQTRLQALEQGGGQLSPDQQKTEVDRFKRELLETRIALRDVQHNLRREVDALGSVLALFNIVLVPLLVAGFAIVLAVLRRRRRARAISL